MLLLVLEVRCSSNQAMQMNIVEFDPLVLKKYYLATHTHHIEHDLVLDIDLQRFYSSCYAPAGLLQKAKVHESCSRESFSWEPHGSFSWEPASTLSAW